MDEWKEVFEVISVIHPSRGRHKQAWETMFNWYLKADNGTNIQWIVSVDEDDPQLFQYKYWFTEATEGIDYLPGFHRSAIEAINNAAGVAKGDILIVVSDDFDCPAHWDTLLLEAIGDKQDFCAKTNDGHQDWLITLPIMDRKYYERFGYVYHPSYKHIYADAEMTTVAWMLDKYIRLDIEFKHNHYSLTGQQPDAINRKNNESWASGKINFMKRFENRFDLNMYFEKPWPFEELKKQGLTHYINEYWDNQLKPKP